MERAAGEWEGGGGDARADFRYVRSQESVNSAHGEGLELVVIWLIVIEIILGVTTVSLAAHLANSN